MQGSRSGETDYLVLKPVYFPNTRSRVPSDLGNSHSALAI